MITADAASSFGLLAILSLSYSTGTRRVERLRRVVTRDRTPNMLGAWTFAAIVSLPVPLIVAAIGTYYAAEWPSRKAIGRGRPKRYIYSACTSALAAVTASGFVRRFPLFGIPVGAAAFYAISITLISAAMLANRQTVDFKMLRDLAAHKVEFLTYALGVAMGEAMGWHLALAVAFVPLLLAVHVSAARRTVCETGAYDPLSELWTEDAWTFQAAEAAATGRWVSVIIIDPHDSTERQIPQIIRGCLEPSDPIGHYGRRSIAVLLTDSGAACVGRGVADRIGHCLERQGVHSTIGVASAKGQELSDLIIAALNDFISARDRQTALPGR